MLEKKVVVQSEEGLHARPAMLLVKDASKFKSEINMLFNGKEYNAKSIVSIMSMGAGKGSQVTLKVSGSDEAAAIETISKLIENIH